MKNKKHKGFTLVEVLVAFAILGIAVLGIGGFFVSAARSYSSVSDETSLQYEAQLTLNQVENMLIDSTLGVSYNYVTGAETPDSDHYHFVKTDSEVAGTAVSKVLYAYNVNENDGSKLDVLLMKWLAAEEKVYYKVIQVTDSGATVDSINISQAEGNWDLLAQDVASFAVDLSEYSATKKVEIDLGFANRSKEYRTTGTVMLRNDVLINENDIHKIYEHVTKVIKSQITGVELTAYTNVTVPGGGVQLKAKVLGTGYPRQDIHQWVVASDSNFTNVLYDSTNTYSTMPKTYLDTVNQVLYVSDDTSGNGSTFNEMLYVKAVVNTTDAAGADITFYDSVSVGVKLISNIEVSVSADTSQTKNSNLKDVSFGVASLVVQRADANDVPRMTLNPGNVVNLSALVTASDTSTAEDKAINWSILSKTEGVVADIDTNGTLEINQYSKVGTFIVRAALKLDSTVYVDYIVEVGTQYNAENSTLVITTSKNSINRGGSLICSLTLNDAPVDNNDYDWSLSVISSNGQEISGTPVTVNAQGGVYANYDLSYDYSYDVWIKAALKVNPEITAMAKITVPKVSLMVSPITKYSVMGATVSGITCKAVGLEEYNIKWSMAKDLNPKYFFTAWGNFNVTGSKNANGEGVATVVLGTEEDPQTNVTVKGYLADNSNYSVIMKIFTGDISMNITGGTTVQRNSSLQLDVSLSSSTSTNITVSKETAVWKITDVKVNGASQNTLIDNTISIDKGLLTVGKEFASAYENYDVILTIRAYDDTYGLEDTHTVTIKAATVGINPDKILIPDREPKTTIQYSNYTGATWSVRRAGYGGSGSSSKISINSSGILTVQANSEYQYDNATYYIYLTVNKKQHQGSLRYGFENDVDYSSTYQYQSGNKKYAFRVGKSDYKVYKNGELCPVYYVNQVEIVQNSGGGGGRPNRPGSGSYYSTVAKYAFVSNSSNMDGTGQWYKYSSTNNNGYWNAPTTTEPTNWNKAYFNVD